MRISALIGSFLALVAVGCGGSSADTTGTTLPGPDGVGDTTPDKREATDGTSDVVEQVAPSPETDGDVMVASNDSVLGVWKGTEKGDQIEWTFNISENHMVVTAGNQELYEGTYTINPESNPRQIIALVTRSNLKQYVGKASNGIFVINGDSLTLAANEPGDESFPNDFTSSGRARVFELTRSK